MELHGVHQYSSQHDALLNGKIDIYSTITLENNCNYGTSNGDDGSLTGNDIDLERFWSVGTEPDYKEINMNGREIAIIEWLFIITATYLQT